MHGVEVDLFALKAMARGAELPEILLPGLQRALHLEGLPIRNQVGQGEPAGEKSAQVQQVLLIQVGGKVVLGGDFAGQQGQDVFYGLVDHAKHVRVLHGPQGGEEVAAVAAHIIPAMAVDAAPGEAHRESPGRVDRPEGVEVLGQVGACQVIPGGVQAPAAQRVTDGLVLAVGCPGGDDGDQDQDQGQDRENESVAGKKFLAPGAHDRHSISPSPKNAGEMAHGSRGKRVGGLVLQVQHGQHGGVQAGVGGQDGVRRVEHVWAAAGLGDDGPGFPGDQQACRQVPDFQLDLPVAVHAPAGHEAQVQGGGAQAADALSPQGEALHVVEVILGVGEAVVGEAGDQQAAGELGLAGGLNGGAVEGGTLAALGGEHFVPDGVVDHRQGHLILMRIGNGDREDRQAVGVVGGAVERVDVPGVVGIPGLVTGFFSHDVVAGEAAADLPQQVGFGLLVDLGDQVDLTFVLDVVGLVKARAQDLSGAASQVFEVFQGWLHMQGLFF